MTEFEPTAAARDIARIFSEVPDPRVCGRCRHKLGDILTIALCTTLCGSSEFTEMEAWGELNVGWLRKFLELPSGIPSHDTFLAVFRAHDPGCFLEAFLLWVGGVRERSAGGVVALDGEACRGTKGAPGEMLTMVGAFASAQGISLGQLQVEGKSNEITAVPRLLDLLDISGCTVTADAMACQKEIVARCRANGADYAIALKGNQGTLHSYVSTYLDELIDGGMEPGHTSVDRRRGRVETRRCWAFGDDLEDWLEGHAQWEGLCSVAAVELEREEKGVTTVERRYFITSLAPDAKRIADVVRAHWSIENSLHWVLDVVFGEDASRARTGNAAANLSTMRRLAHNLIKTTDPGKYKKWTINAS